MLITNWHSIESIPTISSYDFFTTVLYKLQEAIRCKNLKKKKTIYVKSSYKRNIVNVKEFVFKESYYGIARQLGINNDKVLLNT